MPAQSELFQFNQYVPFLQEGDDYLWRTAVDHQVPLPETAVGLVDDISAAKTFTLLQLKEFFTVDQLVELFRHHVLVDPLKPSSERHTRTVGYWSLATTPDKSQRLRGVSVLVLGAGAIGSHVTWMLAALGVARVVVVDYDLVEVSNLNRQILYTMKDVGLPKVEALAQHIRDINPEVIVEPVSQRVAGPGDICALIDRFRCHAVVKALDTPAEVTSWVNEACVLSRVVYVQGGFIGTSALIGPHYVPERTPCWDCFDHSATTDIRHISGGGGTIPHLTEITAGKMVRDLVGILLGESVTNCGSMEIYDERGNESRQVQQRLVATCPTCRADNNRESVVGTDTSHAGIEIVYIMACGFLPLLTGVPGWGVAHVLGSVAVAQLLLIVQRDARRLFRLSFLGGCLYALVVTLLSARLRPDLLQIPAEGFDPVAGLRLLLGITIMMAVVVTVFQWSSMAVYALQQFVLRVRGSVLATRI